MAAGLQRLGVDGSEGGGIEWCEVWELVDADGGFGTDGMEGGCVTGPEEGLVKVLVVHDLHPLPLWRMARRIVIGKVLGWVVQMRFVLGDAPL